MANSRIVFILKRIPSMADPSINDVYPGEHFVTEDSGQLYYKDLQGIIVTVGGGKAAVPASWVYTPSAKNFTFNFEGSNFLEALEPFSSSIRFLTNANTVISAGQNTITINITKNGSTLTTRNFPIVDIIGRELRKASIPGNAICDILFDGTKFRVYNTYGFGSSTDDGSYFFDNNVVVDGAFSVIDSNDKKGFAVLEDGTIVVGNDGVKLTNVTDLFQLKGNSTFDGDINVTGRLTVGNRVYSPKGYDGILLSDIPTLDWTKLTNILPQDKVPAISDNSNKIATTKWVADYIAYLGLTGSGEGGNSTVIDTTIQSTVAAEGQTDFDFDYNVGSLLVLSTGHVLVVGEDYTATDGKKIKFTEPCDADEELMFINIGKLDTEKYLTADQINAIITGSNFATATYVQEQIDALIDGSGDALNTLKELADALNNDPDFAANIANQLADINSKLENKQPLNSNLTAITGLNATANTFPYFTGAKTAELADLTAFAREILMQPNAASLLQKVRLGEGSALPVGVPVPWPSATPPTGWLKCNGAPFSAEEYPKLAKAYPSLLLPDLRGEFIRGWDDGRGVDSGRAILSTQSQSIQKHIHNTQIKTNGSPNQLSGNSYNVTLHAGAKGQLDDPSRTMRTTDIVDNLPNETRPRNIAFNYIVRAA